MGGIFAYEDITRVQKHSLFQFAAGVLRSLGGVGTGVDKGTSQLAEDGLG